MCACVGFMVTLARGGIAPLSNGDRVVLLGTAILEQEQLHGYVESSLTRGAPESRLTFRNLAWTADTLQGHSRSYFGSPEDGLKRLDENLALTRPTVILCCYGADLAFSTNLDQDLPGFLNAYRTWFERIRKQVPEVRFILLSPPPLENKPPPRPNQDAANRNLESLAAALEDFARKEGVDYIDTFHRVQELKGDRVLTFNGVLYQEQGYQVFAQAITEGMGLAWSGGGPKALREMIVEKDRLFFNRYRPANETYLFLFRKHEQGQNAKEMPMFDPLIQELDEKIHTAKSTREAPQP